MINPSKKVVEMFSGGGDNSPPSTMQIMVVALCCQPGISGHHLAMTFRVLAEARSVDGKTRLEILELARLAHDIEDALQAPD